MRNLIWCSAIVLGMAFGAGTAVAGKAVPSQEKKEKNDAKKDKPKACKTANDCGSGPFECRDGFCQEQPQPQPPQPMPPT